MSDAFKAMAAMAFSLALMASGDVPPPVQAPAVVALAFGDFNGDGRQDLALATNAAAKNDPAKNGVALFYNRGGGFAAAPDRFLPVASPTDLLAGDFDGDGKTDLAVKERRRLTLFLGGENFAVPRLDLNVNERAAEIDVGKLNARGKMDFVSGPVWRRWFGGDTFVAGFFPAPTKTPFGQSRIADINVDGDNDLVFLDRDNIVIYYGPFTTMPKTVRAEDCAEVKTIALPGEKLTTVAVGDLDGDDRPDLVAASRDRVFLLSQSRPIGFISVPLVSATLSGCRAPLLIGDFDNDKKAELLVGAASGKAFSLRAWRRDGKTDALSEVTPRNFVGQARAMAVGDIDGDAFPDLAISDGALVRFFPNFGRDFRSPR